jgi:diketogulonate reductase-like aldo/keto reductase
MIERRIPSTNEVVPVIGLGTWQTFDVTNSKSFPPLSGVLRNLHNGGGRLIDTSPMYGHSEEVLGKLLHHEPIKNDFFYATKVWIEGREAGIQQMEQSMKKMGRSSIDLMQIHNLVDWEVHLDTLKEWKQQGKIRYIGITHYTDSLHKELERIITKVPLDFVQFNYSIMSRNAEKSLLPAAADHGVATLINRPLGEGRLMAAIKGKDLPPWAVDYGISSWSQFFQKFIVSQPAVTCVIPATSNPAHMADNLMAGLEPLPDGATRERMAAYVASL